MTLRPRRAAARVAVTILPFLVVNAAPQLAQAADGQWWYDFYSVDAIHAQGLTGAGIRIAVVDEQINPDLPVFADADLTVSREPLCVGEEAATSQVNDNSRHGSTVTALLVGNGQGAGGIRGIVPDASVTFYGYGNTDHEAEKDQCNVPKDVAAAAMAADPDPNTRRDQAAGIGDPREYLSSWGWAVERAMDDGADIITTSVGATDAKGDELMVAKALRSGVLIVAATPNNDRDLVLLPWSYRGVVAASAMDADGEIQVDPTYGVPMAHDNTTVTAAGIGFSSIGAPGGSWDDSNTTTGSSLAAPLVAGMLALSAQKYPDATANQLLQSLVINTGVDDHRLERDTTNGYGYGYASPNHMLRKDPTRYDDVNPLLDKLSFDRPSDEQFADADLPGTLSATRSAGPTPTADSSTASSTTSSPGTDHADPTASSPERDGDESPWTPLTVAGLAVGVGLLGAVASLVVTRRRRSTRAD